MTVSAGNDVLFYNKARGGGTEELKYDLDFDSVLPLVSLGQDLQGLTIINVRGAVKWLEDERIVKGNIRVRKCLLKSQEGEVPITIWHDAIDQMVEKHVYVVKMS